MTPRTAEEARLLEGFAQTDAMTAADEAVRNSTPESEPENWTHLGTMGWVYTGPLRTETTATKATSYKNRGLGGPDHNIRRVFSTGTNGWLGGGDFLRKAEQGGVGWGGFTQDSWDALKAAGGGSHPLIDTNPHDHAKILEEYANPNYNPFFWEHQRKGGATAGSVPDYLYNQLKGSVANRRKVMQAYQSYGSGGGSVYGGNSELADRMMTEALYNEMGLGDILGQYTGEYRRPGMLGPGNKIDHTWGGDTANSDRQRQGVWGAGYKDGGYGLFSDENKAMRDAIGDQLEKKLLG